MLVQYIICRLLKPLRFFLYNKFSGQMGLPGGENLLPGLSAEVMKTSEVWPGIYKFER